MARPHFGSSALRVVVAIVLEKTSGPTWSSSSTIAPPIATIRATAASIFWSARVFGRLPRLSALCDAVVPEWPQARGGNAMARIRHIVLTTKNPSRTAEFYKQAFGLKELRRSCNGAVFLTDGDGGDIMGNRGKGPGGPIQTCLRRLMRSGR